jgi:hypothetical protein
MLAAALVSAGAAGAQWRFVVTCDSRGTVEGINQVILAEIAAEVKDLNADFVLFPGDLVSGSGGLSPDQFEAQLTTWVRIMKPVYDANIPVYVGRGNHEVGDNWSTFPIPGLDPNDNFATRWLNVFGSDLYPKQKLPGNGPPTEQYMTYSVTHKNACVVMLDNYAGTGHALDHKVNQRWLDRQLAANTRPHVFVAAHEQAFRALHVDCLDNHPAERDRLWAALRSAGARTYFCGHDHFYDHARIDDGDGNPDNDIHQYIIGTAGAVFYSFSPPYSGNNSIYTPQQWHYARRYGYVLVEVDDLDVTLTWIQRQTNDLDVAGVYTAAEVWAYSVTPAPIVLSPNGGERLAAGRTHMITWKTTDGAPTQEVAIDYSDDDGRTWQQVGTLQNTGALEWQPPPVDSNECLVRVTDLQDTALSDSSDETFTILRCRRELKGDLNADCYVDFSDLAILLEDWLKCGSILDPACEVQE